mgnify:FL=1
MSSVSVIGLGYVGLTFAACLANKGFRVYGVESDEDKRKLILEGKPPFYEPGLDSLLSKAISCGSLMVMDDLQSAIRDSYITFVCVGTPSRADGSVDLSQVESAVREIGRALKGRKEYHLVVLRSTVPPRTTEGLVRELLERESGKIAGSGFGLCFNPEFLSEGKAIEGVTNPDRLVIGAVDERSGKLLLEFYRKFYSGRLPPTLLTNPVNAELIKYANNAFLAMKISFANMFSRLCSKLRGADVKVVMKGIGMDSRICNAFLGAGLGWGGSCFPKDTRGILSYARGLGVDLKLVKASIEVNEEQVDYALELAESLVGSLGGKLVAVLGLAFKPGTDDVRESRAIRLVERLLEKGARVRVHDPKAMDNARRILGDRVEYAISLEDCLRDADLCVLATEWPEYRELGQEDLIRLMRSPALLDCRRIYDPGKFRRVRFAAIGLGPTS